MGEQTQQYIQVAAAAGQTLMWLILALICLSKARTGARPPAWTSLGAVGATVLFVPAMTVTTANLEILFVHSDQMFRNLYASGLLFYFTLMQVTGTALLVGALLAGRRRVRLATVAPVAPAPVLTH